MNKGEIYTLKKLGLGCAFKAYEANIVGRRFKYDTTHLGVSIMKGVPGEDYGMFKPGKDQTFMFASGVKFDPITNEAKS